MSVKVQAVKLKQVVGGILGIRRREIVKYGSYALNFVLGFLMASVRVFEVCAPFGIGMVAEAGAGISGVICLVGASVSYLIFGGFDWGIKYIACAMLVYTASYSFKGIRLHREAWFMPSIAALITAITGTLNTIELIAPIPAPILITAEITLAGGSAYFFKIALSSGGTVSEAGEAKRNVSILILASCALMAFSNLIVLGIISVGRVAAMLIVMTAACKGGPLAGSAAGAALGLAMDISTGGTPFFTMAYSFSGLLSGGFGKNSRFVFTLSYVLANAVAVLWTWGGALRLEILYETFAASVAFMILPASFLSFAGRLLEQPVTGRGEADLRRYSSARLRRVSKAFSELYETARRTVGTESNDNDIATVFDRAADSVCVSCRQRDECWQRDYLETLNIMNDVTRKMTERGRLEPGDLPVRFAERCESMKEFVAAVNAELRGITYRRQYKIRLAENRAAAYGQYADMSSVLENFANELDGRASSEPAVEHRLSKYLHGMDISAEVSAFRDVSGRLRVTIESERLLKLVGEPDYLEKLSAVAGERLCRPVSDLGTETLITVVEAEPLAASVGVAAMKKKGESASGDRGTYFKTDQGVLCVILSDGMGSGHAAARESVAAVRILEYFLRSGVRPRTAMKILNSVMLLKNGDAWGYATVDLMCVDLFSGETCFYKYGAAPSYVRNGSSIRRVRGDSLAPGMCAGAGAYPDVIRMKLKPGSVAIIASDGVLAEEDDHWLRQMLLSFRGDDAKTLARDALQNAVRQYGCEDDMTVLAVYVDKRA